MLDKTGIRRGRIIQGKEYLAWWSQVTPQENCWNWERKGLSITGIGEKQTGAGEHSGQLKTSARDAKSTKVTLCLGVEGRIKMTTEEEMGKLGTVEVHPSKDPGCQMAE